MIQAYVATDLVDAELAAAALIAAGVSAVVQGDVVAIPSGPFPTVWVEEDTLEQAREILAARQTPPGKSAGLDG
jgi:hypothetical protein